MPQTRNENLDMPAEEICDPSPDMYEVNSGDVGAGSDAVAQTATRRRNRRVANNTRTPSRTQRVLVPRPPQARVPTPAGSISGTSSNPVPTSGNILNHRGLLQSYPPRTTNQIANEPPYTTAWFDSFQMPQIPPQTRDLTITRITGSILKTSDNQKFIYREFELNMKNARGNWALVTAFIDPLIPHSEIRPQAAQDLGLTSRPYGLDGTLPYIEAVICSVPLGIGEIQLYAKVSEEDNYLERDLVISRAGLALLEVSFPNSLFAELVPTLFEVVTV
jgi:hypothetical protein